MYYIHVMERGGLLDRVQDSSFQFLPVRSLGGVGTIYVRVDIKCL